MSDARHGHGPSAPADAAGVRFVVVPFLPEHQPALGVSSLAAVLREHAIPCDVRYLNIELRGRIGKDAYAFIANEVPTIFLLGDLVFAKALWGGAAPAWDAIERRYRDAYGRITREVLSRRDDPSLLDDWEAAWQRHAATIRQVFEEGPQIVARWAEEVLRGSPRLVGLTSTFQQNGAALALARELRRRVPRPELRIVFGGANCEDDMGRALADTFDFVDHVVSGEAESVIVGLARSILDGSGDDPPRFVQGAMISDLDALPLPVFDDYFAAIGDTDLEQTANLVAESSRGCWWGMKSHCTFCGLNGNTMAFRSKSPARFAEELRALSHRHQRKVFTVTDNILDLKYLTSLFPELLSRGDGIRMFYETKANLRKDQLELMAAAGIYAIQPGIESLSTTVLELMAKGTTRLQNIQLLKWCEELGVAANWNLLYGFPGEPPKDYAAMAELIPLLGHLPPPVAVSRIRLDRFAPYWRAPGRHGIKNVRRYWSYDFALGPLAPDRRERLAYYFEFDYADDRSPHRYAGDVVRAAQQWSRAYRDHATLEVFEFQGRWHVLDTRDPDRRRRCAAGPDRHPLRTTLMIDPDLLVPVSEGERRLLRALDSARSPSAAHARLNEGRPADDRLSEPELEGMLAGMLERGWVVGEGARCLSLVLDRTERDRVARRRLAFQPELLGLLG